jgi:hypothetical protein
MHSVRTKPGIIPAFYFEAQRREDAAFRALIYRFVLFGFFLRACAF